MAQLIVSISGIRGIVGDGLGPREARRFGLAFGTLLGRGTVVLGRDSRPSGPMLADALRAGLVATGLRVVDCGILSTPGTAVMVRHLAAAGGAVITASHNPLPYNGIKLLSPAGMALSRDAGRKVLDLYERQAPSEVGTDHAGPTEVAPGSAEAKPDSAEPKPGAAAVHVEKVLAIADAERIRKAALCVVVDAVNGAGGAEMALLLERLGCQCILVHGEPTGRFGRGAEPIPENLGDLGRAVREHGAALGLALDPDADRLALVDETGRAIGEEYTLALACRHRLTEERGPLACNLSTSRMMDYVAAEAGVALHRTPVGEVNVAEEIEREGCLIGGEGNGGVIDPRVVPVRDSLVGAALVLGMLAARRRPLSELAAELPVYTIVKDKATLAAGDAAAAYSAEAAASATKAGKAAAVFDAVRKRFPGARADTRDGLYLAMKEGWVHVRASNTEPILRIMAEAADEQAARTWVRDVKAVAEAAR
jgi:phosphomannomutase